MKEYVLNYYPEFKCVAGDCKHTCCAGWEMNIDAHTLAVYNADKTAFGERLRSGVNFKKSQFRADKNGRCAFLNGDGLCDIIKNLGKNSLCQVCRDHPRFRSFFDDRTEMGLGFCCEEATRIILSFKDKIAPVLVFDDKKEQELDFCKATILEFRQKVLGIVQDREKDINDRVSAVLSLCNVNFDKANHKSIIKTFLSLERLDKGWTARLKGINNEHFVKEVVLNLSSYAEQFLANSIYRHLHCADDVIYARAIVVACVLSWWVIENIYFKEKSREEDFALLIDVVRAFSAEVEYSQKNLDKLFNFCYKLIKI